MIWMLSIFLIPILLSVFGLVYSIRENRIENRETKPAISASAKDWVSIDDACWDIYRKYLLSVESVKTDDSLTKRYDTFARNWDHALSGKPEAEARVATAQEWYDSKNQEKAKKKLVSWKEERNHLTDRRMFYFTYDTGQMEAMMIDPSDPFQVRKLEEYITSAYSDSKTDLLPPIVQHEIYSTKHGKYLSELQEKETEKRLAQETLKKKYPRLMSDIPDYASLGELSPGVIAEKAIPIITPAYELISIYKCDYCNVKWSQRDENSLDYERCLGCGRDTAASELITRPS